MSYVSPDDAPDATMPPSTLLRRRVVAVGPGTGHCAIVLALQTHTVLRRDERTEPLDSAVVREILAGARR
ncbi:hypothetical protein [Gemmatirosa kalamazoonensis]|uniref:hypothetical protein n=1 Tax=Gemmatirosa kalamazoonensis TaxID=861299 RepID=UPI0004B489DE|nr:hypothetical protein [Gemmatirosa kalamazoonensis]